LLLFQDGADCALFVTASMRSFIQQSLVWQVAAGLKPGETFSGWRQNGRGSM
jgi:hypothetical protein